MGSQATSARRRATDRSHAATAGLIVLCVAALVGLVGKVDSWAADHRDSVAAAVKVHDTRTCAAVAVYSTSTADDWSQRAVIAQANLNLFQAAGVPDCYPDLVSILGNEFDERRWQAALAAVDAVSSGSYAIPLACERVDSVAPLTSPRELSPSPGLSARSQCVINGLAFWEQRA